MRKRKAHISSDYRIMVVDDDAGIIDSLSVVLGRSGYHFRGLVNPMEAIDELNRNHYDLLILDFIMSPINGDKVVEKIRGFNNELYILLLTGHKDLAPPLETIKQLDIQGYCEKSDRFDQLMLLIESGIKSISQVRTIKKFRDGLNKILESVPKIYQLQPIGNILEDILTEIMPLVDSENAFILIDDFTRMDNEEHKSIFKGIGKYKTQIEDFFEMLSPNLMEHIGYARTSKEVVRMEQGIIIPLISEYLQSMGVIYIEREDSEEGIKLLEIYAYQAASSLNNAFLHSLVNIKNEELNSTYEQLRTRYMDTIEALRHAVDAKDSYTKGHSDRVANYAVEIGKIFNFNEDELEMLRVSGVFHDIGKIGTVDDILLKTERLSDEEYEEIKKHPLKGAHILSAVSMFKDIVPIIKCHHERIDGRGYPEGLKGDQIPFMSRIIAVADAFDAMTSDRLYRSKLSFEEAKNQLIRGKGTQFDISVVEKFITLLENDGQIELYAAASSSIKI